MSGEDNSSGDESVYCPEDDEESDGSGDELEGDNSESEQEEMSVEDKSGHIDRKKINKSKKTKPGKCKPRIKKECPVPYCHTSIVHIPRHLEKVHHWPKHQACAAVSRFNMRKKYKFSTAECTDAGNRKRKPNDEKNETKVHKDYHKKRVCPIVGCMAVVQRLPAHLQNVHGFSPSKSTYRSLLRKAFKQPKRPYSVQLIEKRAAEEGKVVVESDVPVVVESDVPIVVEDEMSDDHVFDDCEQFVDSEQADTTTACDYVEFTEDTDENSDNGYPESILQLAKWLQSPDGGKKDAKTAKQHVSQINKMLSVIDEERRLASLLDISLLKNKFVVYAEEKYVAETIRWYFMSLRHFYSYVLAEKPEEITAPNEVVIQLIEKVKRWSASYKKSSLKRKWEKMEEDRIELVTPEKIQQFESSHASREAVILLGQLSGGHNMEMTQSHYTLLRDFLLVEISIDNANRAGVLSNMTTLEFERGYKEDDRFIINVMDHKTFHVHGPAQVVLTSNLHNWISVFIKEVRSRVPTVGAEKEKEVFLSWNGKKLQSSQIGKAIQSVWKKAGISGHIHRTLLRKGAVTTCHNNNKDISSNLADLMAHKEDTARRYYRLTEKGKSSVKASQELHVTMRKKSCKEEVNKLHVLSEQDEQDLQPGYNEEKSEHARVPWGVVAVDEIQKLFRSEIQEKNISLNCVKERIVRNEILKTEDPKRVYDRVRSEWRFPGTDNNKVISLPKEGEELKDKVDRMFRNDPSGEDASSDIVPPTSLTSKAKAIFSDGQVGTLLRLCEDMLQNMPIPRKEIQKRLSNDAKGKTILATLTLSQVVNRIKYERRQRREKID